MSLNDIKIHPQLLAGLYPDTLIETNIVLEEQQEAPVVIEKDQPFHYSGKNEKHILILANSEKADHLPGHELKFLLSVLKACRLTQDDVAIMNLHNQPADHNGLQDFFQNKVALLFGITPSNIDLPMNFPPFQLQVYNKCTYLHAPSLTEIEKEKELKMKLWACLKNLFSL